jgi:hypothetical protein
VEIKDFTFSLLMLGIPGISCYFLLKKLVGKIGADTVESVLSIFVLSVLSYAASDLFFWVSHFITWLPWGKTADSFGSVNSLFAESPKLAEKAVLLATFFSVPVAWLLSWFHHKKVWNRFSQWLGISRRFGDEDLFVLLLDGGANQERWYVVRDHKEDLSYYGAIVFWSDEGPDRELIMADVDVFSNQGEAARLYSCKSMYICRNRDDISIELDPAPPSAKLEANERPTEDPSASEPV